MKSKNTIKLTLIFILLFGFDISLLAQETDEDLFTSKDIMIGVWKVDLLNQRKNLDSSEKTNLEKMNSKEQEDFWEKSNSWVYALTEENLFSMSWVDNGVYFEETGTWDFDGDKMILSLITDQTKFQYRVNIANDRMIWVSISPSKEQFKTLYIKGIGQ